MKVFALVCLYSMYFVVAVIFYHAKGDKVYEFSTFSSQTMSEVLKFAMSVVLFKNEQNIRWSNVYYVYWAQMGQGWCFFGSFILSICYSINNQLTFLLYTLTTPVIISLIKSASPVVTAVLTLLIMRQNRTQLGWLALVIQTLGMIVAQYDPCKGALRMDNIVYVMGLLSLTLTSSCSVFNTELLKRFSVTTSMHAINMTMYVVGALFNFLLHHHNNVNNGGPGIYENYTGYTLLVILCNSLLGLAVTYVYKYADAIIKTLAQSLNICSLLLFGPVLFGSTVEFMEVVGTTIVCLATYIYVNSSSVSQKTTLPK